MDSLWKPRQRVTDLSIVTIDPSRWRPVYQLSSELDASLHDNTSQYALK